MCDAPPERVCPEGCVLDYHNLYLHLMGDGGASIDRFFDALRERRRRLILVYLNEHDCADLDQLAMFIAKDEGVDADDTKVDQIEVNLHHQQLPKLADHGLISYDPRTTVACIEPVPGAVERILDLTQDLEDLNTP